MGIRLEEGGVEVDHGQGDLSSTTYGFKLLLGQTMGRGSDVLTAYTDGMGEHRPVRGLKFAEAEIFSQVLCRVKVVDGLNKRNLLSLKKSYRHIKLLAFDDNYIIP